MLSSKHLLRALRSAGRSTLLSSPTVNRLPSIGNNLSPIACCKDHEVNYSSLSSLLRRFGMSSSATPEPKENERTGSAASDADASGGGNAKPSSQVGASSHAEAKEPRQDGKSESEPEGEEDLSIDDLVKLVAEKEELLKLKHKKIEEMQDKVLRSYAEMENVMDRTRREAENAKKYAIQNFAKSLLDVADNLARASSVVKESFSKIDASSDTTGAVPLLKTLLEGVEMTEKQLLEVFKKFGIEKYDPQGEHFDPHRHNAAFQISDSTKPPGSVAVVLKPGYLLYDRVIRPAEVGVTQAVEGDT
ncbi:hypothetical protein MLD38_022086 [Melastoma candidum]|uniref:Uncharacterized protein n=1 Tax=Melastoma candidum TaxID=119954 RepID=A0ACB9QL40_9MYRT|nr:hypothetical protein MLD38_022086 [Melastoma candidum]